MAASRIESEKKIVGKMILIYCKGQKHGGALCGECRELMEYAHKRLDSCKFGENKVFCSKCAVHCYQPGMRERIKTVMKYSGPRMLLYHPVMAVKHFLQR